MNKTTKIIATILTPLTTIAPITTIAACSKNKPDTPVDPTQFKDLLVVSSNGICSGWKSSVTQKRVNEVITGSELTFPDEITSFSEGAFDAKGDQQIKIPSCVQKVNMPANLQAISNYAFRNNEFIEVVFKENKTQLVIGDSAFESCAKLTKVNLPEGLTSIGEKAFTSDTEITEIKIPSTILNIGKQAFWNCSKLAKIDTSAFANTFVWKRYETQHNDEGYNGYYDWAWEHGDEIFSNISPAGKILIKKQTANLLGNILVKYVVGAENWEVEATDKTFTTLDIKATSVLNGFKDDALEEDKLQECAVSLFIPENVTEIAEKAFVRGEKTTIPQAVEKETNGVTTLKFIGNKCSKIGPNAFKDCKSIKFINVDEIGDVPAGWDSTSFAGWGTSGVIYCISPYENNWKTYFESNGFIFGENNWSILTDTWLDIQEDTVDNKIVLKGFRAGVTEEQLKEEFKDGKLIIPPIVEKIDTSAFYDTNNDVSKIPAFMTSIEFADGSICSEIGVDAFKKAPFTNTLTIKSKMDIKGDAFKNSSISGINLLAGTSSFGKSAFAGCTNLKTIDFSNFNNIVEMKDNDQVFTNIAPDANIIISDNTDRVAAWQKYSSNGFDINNQHTITYKTKPDNFCIDQFLPKNIGFYKRWVQDPIEQHIYDEGGNFLYANDGKKIEWNSAGYVGGSWTHRWIIKQQFDFKFTYLNKFGMPDLAGKKINIKTQGIQEVYNEKNGGSKNPHHPDHKLNSRFFNDFNLNENVDSLITDGNTGYGKAYFTSDNKYWNFHQEYGTAGSGWGRAWWYGWKITDNKNGNYTLTLDVTCVPHGHAVQGHVNEFDSVDMVCKDDYIKMVINII